MTYTNVHKKITPKQKDPKQLGTGSTSLLNSMEVVRGIGNWKLYTSRNWRVSPGEMIRDAIIPQGCPS